MYKELVAVLGKHITDPEFIEVQQKYFPEFKLGKNKDQFKDKSTKMVLCFAALTAHDSEAPVPEDPNEFKYFTAFFFGKDISEVPFGITPKDSEEQVIAKAGKPTHHHKIVTDSVFESVNNMHYHLENNVKLIVNFDPQTGKPYGDLGINLRLPGMKF
jgi:hypothetical protein